MNTPVVLITGALTGIGRAAALAFAKSATVVVSGRPDVEGKALESELLSLGAKAAFILADVRHEDDVRNLVEQTVARFGRLDVAVNNVGTEGRPGPLTEQTSDSYARMFDTNVLGTLLSLKYELQVMQPQRSGSIINISSTMGERGSAESSALHRKQARGGRSHKVRCSRSRPLRRSRQCGCAWSDRDRDARSSDGRARQESSLLCVSTAQTRCEAGRDRQRRLVPRFR